MWKFDKGSGVIRLVFSLVALFLCSGFAIAEYPQRFAGEWRSEKSGHHGPMRARFTPTVGGYDMRVVGRFAAIIPFTYRTHLDVVGETPDGLVLAAEKSLGMFGTFRTRGVLSADGFRAEYSAMKDRGRITLFPRR